MLFFTDLKGFQEHAEQITEHLYYLDIPMRFQWDPSENSKNFQKRFEKLMPQFLSRVGSFIEFVRKIPGSYLLVLTDLPEVPTIIKTGVLKTLYLKKVFSRAQRSKNKIKASSRSRNINLVSPDATLFNLEKNENINDNIGNT